MFFVNSETGNKLTNKLFINDISYKTGYTYSSGATQMSLDLARFSAQFSSNNWSYQ